MARPKKSKEANAANSYFEKLETEVSSNQSKVSLVLGGLIVLVVGILLFNYFSKQGADLGPAQQTTDGDVAVENLPGKYTVKEGDTLFTIAEKYYQDGYKYTEIASANNIENPDSVELGTVLEIPKLEETIAEAPTESAAPTETPAATEAPETTPTPEASPLGTGTGGGDTTIWGEKITGDSYTVQTGDWLSTIAGRAYGDILSYEKIAEANNIDNPDVIEVGMVLKLPR